MVPVPRSAGAKAVIPDPGTNRRSSSELVGEKCAGVTEYDQAGRLGRRPPFTDTGVSEECFT